MIRSEEKTLFPHADPEIMSNTHYMRVSGLGVLIMKSKLILNHFYPRNSLWCF